MTIKNRYLKYYPEITLEIFTLVWNKLIEYRFKQKYGYNLNNEFECFKNNHNYLIIEDDTFNTYLKSCIFDNVEITVQEILGYDPFLVKKVIPEYVEIKSGREDANYNHWLGAKDKVNYHYKRKYKVLKVVDSNSEYSDTLCYLLVDPDGNYANFKAEACNISSREAYEFQNKPKQPLKQAVHCKTQEEYKFAKETLGATFYSNAYIVGESIIPLDAVGSTINLNRFGHSFYNDYQLLSFQEWCDLNGYKMEKEVKFEVGKWYKMNDCWYLKYKGKGIIATDKIYMSECIDSTFNHKYDNGFVAYLHEQKTWRLASIEEIQQYLPDSHPDKLPLKTKDMILDESYVGKLVSLTYNNRFYDEVLITKEYGIGIYLLNNVCSNNDGHHNKSVYKYSLYFNDFQDANLVIKDIKFLDKPVEKQSNQEFKVGDYVICIEVNNNPKAHGAGWNLNKVFKIHKFSSELDCLWPEKGDGVYRTYIRHATPEEINQHLISIGQIPAGEPLNNGIEPNKDGMFKYKSTLPGSSWTGLTPTNHLRAMYQGDIMGKPVKPKMILSIDDEELPMVNIIKTNSIKQLLNND